MSQLKCLPDSMAMLQRFVLRPTVPLVVLLVFAHLSYGAPPASPLQAAPHQLHRFVRSPKANLARGFQAKVSDNPHQVFLKTEPHDVHIDIGNVGIFSVFLTEKPTENVVISFKCAEDKPCTTFDNSTVGAVTLTPERFNVSVNFTALYAGHDAILIDIQQKPSGLNISTAYGFVRVRVGHSYFIAILGQIIGWIYFFCWSISFWPQNISNYKRKSVVGLNFDYTILHFTGFLFYSIFNLTLYFSSNVQVEYEQRYPRSEIPVELNDVVYSIHAAAATSITWCQCMVYEAGNQRLSIYGKLFQGIAWGIGGILLVLCLSSVFTWLNFIYYFSYVKLLITAVKYLPQLIFNFRRKSTAGWSIYMIYLDISGGSSSMLQMLIIAYNYNDWKTLSGNLPKLGLAIASILYDIIFLLQEFVFYPNSNNSSKSKAKAREAAATNLSRRSTLKEAGDSQDQLCSMNSSISSLPSSISSTSTRSASETPGFRAQHQQNQQQQPKHSPAQSHEPSDEQSKGTKGPGPASIDLSSQLDAILLRRKSTTAETKPAGQ